MLPDSFCRENLIKDGSKTFLKIGHVVSIKFGKSNHGKEGTMLNHHASRGRLP